MLAFSGPLASLPRRIGTIAPLLAVFAAIALPHTAIAEDQRSGFAIDEWTVAESCGEQEHFEALVSEAVGDWPEHLPAVRVKIVVTRKRRNLVLVLQTQGTSGNGRRELVARTCEELLATGAVVLSLALDSEALRTNELTHEVVTAAHTDEAAKPKTASEPLGPLDDENPILHAREQPDDSPMLRTSEALDTSLRLVSLTEVGTLPRAALGLGIVAGAHSGPYRVAFRLVRWAEQVQFVGNTDERGGSFDLLSGSMHLCRELSHGSMLVGFCALGTVARISATGIAFAPQSAVNILGSAGIGMFHDLPIGPTRVRIHAEGAGQINRPRYVLNQGMSSEAWVHQPSRLAMRAGLSWGMSF